MIFISKGFKGEQKEQKEQMPAGIGHKFS